METINQTRLYFAYGSNLKLATMEEKCHNPIPLGIAKLANHTIGFYGNSVIWDGAVETLVPDEQEEVWGVLYQLGAYAWEQLDNCEDARLDGTGEYFHYPVEVLDEQGTKREASVYKKARLGEKQTPSSEYLTLILQGAKEQELPEFYINTLEKITSKPASYIVPRLRKQARVEVSSSCDGCSE